MKTHKFIAFSAVVILLAGCSQVHKQLGIGRHSPDEFTVVKRAPLTLPPEYALLPPDPDATARNEANDVTRKQARMSIFGEDSEEELKTADQAFLGKMKVDEADPDIRKALDKDSGFVPVKEDVIDKILFWEAPKMPEGNVINPTEEIQRLKDVKSQGNSVLEVVTPEVSPEKE